MPNLQPRLVSRHRAQSRGSLAVPLIYSSSQSSARIALSFCPLSSVPCSLSRVRRLFPADLCPPSSDFYSLSPPLLLSKLYFLLSCRPRQLAIYPNDLY